MYHFHQKKTRWKVLKMPSICLISLRHLVPNPSMILIPIRLCLTHKVCRTQRIMNAPCLMSTFTESDDEKPTVDDLTFNWPVPNEMATDLREIMSTHCAQPLPVYKNDKYIEPTAVKAAINGALVEVHFTVRHFRIWRKATNEEPATNIDSFTGDIQQIIILNDAVPRMVTGYKRKNLADGPFRPKSFSDTHTTSSPTPSTSNLPASTSISSASIHHLPSESIIHSSSQSPPPPSPKKQLATVPEPHQQPTTPTATYTDTSANTDLPPKPKKTSTKTKTHPSSK